MSRNLEHDSAFALIALLAACSVDGCDNRQFKTL
jgi:hypothetical protein